MGKGLAEFRKASDDFKRTWEREVALESARADDNSLLEADRQVAYETESTSNKSVSVDTPDPELVVAREQPTQSTPEQVWETPPEATEHPVEAAQPEAQPVRKQEWL
jgi:hypothetical protein